MKFCSFWCISTGFFLLFISSLFLIFHQERFSRKMLEEVRALKCSFKSEVLISSREKSLVNFFLDDKLNYVITVKWAIWIWHNISVPISSRIGRMNKTNTSLHLLFSCESQNPCKQRTIFQKRKWHKFDLCVAASHPATIIYLLV